LAAAIVQVYNGADGWRLQPPVEKLVFTHPLLIE